MAIKCLHSHHTASEDKTKAKKPQLDEEKPKEEKEGPEEVKTCNLKFIKHDWFEKDKDLLTIHMYVRQLNSDLLDIGVFENELHVTFSSSHEEFLKLYPGSSKNTVFNWNVKLRGLIDVTSCSFKILKYMLEITLKKKTQGRWGSLELPNIAGLTSVASEKPKKFTKMKPVSSPSSSKTSFNGTDAFSSKTISEEKNDTSTDEPCDMELSCDDNTHETARNGKEAKMGNTCPGSRNSMNLNSGIEENGLPPAISVDDSLKESSSVEAIPLPPPPPPPPVKSFSSDGSKKVGVMGGGHAQGCALPFSEAIRAAVDTGESAVKATPQEKQVVCIKPGFTGLENLGNTCYLNSIVQCLANTRCLRDFLLAGDYKEDINSDNPLGFGGKLALVFANLVKNMWSGKSKHIPPQQLKNIVGDKVCQFKGFMQQDAQEFMAFLLDGLHEDLNRILNKPYTEEVEGVGKPDHEVANEAWKRHKSRNDSVIVDLFQGQLKSKLTCPVCKKISIKYDPFMNLSVPLPKEQKLLSVVVFFKDPSRRPLKVVVKVCHDAGLEQLQASVERKTGIRVENMIVFEEYQGKFHKFFDRGSSLSDVRTSDNIFVCEVLSSDEAGEEVYEVPVMQRLLYPTSIPLHCADCFRNQNPNEPLKRCTSCFAIGYCNKKCQEKHWPIHKRICRKSGKQAVGVPFIVSMPASQATFTRLKDLAEEYARYSVDVRDGELSTSDPEKCETRGQASSSRESAGSSSDSSLDAPPRFFFKPLTLHGESHLGPEGTRLSDQGDQPLDLADKYLALDWRNNPRTPDNVIVNNKQLECEEHMSCMTEELALSYSCTLQECLELFTQPEKLGADDAWHCPKCKVHREATKQLSVWRLPEILIIHLKRFSFKNIMYRDKITKLVEFPIRGLDMSPFTLDKTRKREDVYDLFAVANHMGTVNFGHYTAFGRLQPGRTCVNGVLDDELDWRYFDDRSVTATSEERVVSKYAYVLFYQRRSTTPEASSITTEETSLPSMEIPPPTATPLNGRQSFPIQTPAPGNKEDPVVSQTDVRAETAVEIEDPDISCPSANSSSKRSETSNGTSDCSIGVESLRRDLPSSVTLSSVSSHSLADVDECELD